MFQLPDRDFVSSAPPLPPPSFSQLLLNLGLLALALEQLLERVYELMISKMDTTVSERWLTLE